MNCTKLSLRHGQCLTVRGDLGLLCLQQYELGFDLRGLPPDLSLQLCFTLKLPRRLRHYV